MLFWKSKGKKEQRHWARLHLFKPNEFVGDMFEDMGIPVPLNDLLAFLLTTTLITTIFAIPFIIEWARSSSGLSTFPSGFTLPARFSLLAAYLYLAACAARFVSLLLYTIFEMALGKTHRRVIYLQFMVKPFGNLLFSFLGFLYFTSVLDFNILGALNRASLTWTNWANEQNAFKLMMIYMFMSFALFVEKVAIYFITDRYEAQSQESRINMDTVEVVEKLRKRYYGESDLVKRSGLSLEFLEQDILNSREIAYSIYSNVRGHSLATKSSSSVRESKGLTQEDFEGILDDHETSLLFHAIDFDESGDISKEELSQALKLVYEERKHNFKARMDASSIFLRLESIFFFIILYQACIFSTFLFDLDAIMLVFSALGLTAFAWLGADDTIQKFFKTGNVIFFIHPFDIGDRIIYGDTTFTVKSIHFLSTELVGPANSTTYMMNYRFDCERLTNLRRSDFQSESVELHIAPSSMSPEKLDRLEGAMNSFLQKNGDDYMPRCSIGPLNWINTSSAKTSISYTHKGNFNDGSLQGKRCRAFNRELYRQFKAVGLEYGG